MAEAATHAQEPVERHERHRDAHGGDPQRDTLESLYLVLAQRRGDIGSLVASHEDSMAPTQRGAMSGNHHCWDSPSIEGRGRGEVDTSVVLWECPVRHDGCVVSMLPWV